MMRKREDIYAYVHDTLKALMEDWDDADTILGPETKLFTELGMESLDAVVLGTFIQERFGVEMPFGEMYSELGEQERDISLSELVDFVHEHLTAAVSASSQALQ